MRYRVFAVSAATILVLVSLNVLSNPVSASDMSPEPLGEGTTYGPGYAVTNRLDGSVLLEYLPTFQRWDGVWKPLSALNSSSGDWPYFLTDGPASFSVTRLGTAFEQAKVPGAAYEFGPEAIKETIAIPDPPQTPVLIVPLTTTGLDVGLVDATVALSVPGGPTMWTAGGFHAWDSTPVPKMWPNAVSSLAYADGILSLTLNADMLADAVYPLYVDPTWTLSDSLGWGASVFQDAVEDQGDHRIKIGWLADNFDDNVNEIWTIDAGVVTFADGTMQMPTGASVHAGGPWYNQTLGLRVEFTTLGGIGISLRKQDWPEDDRYQLFVSGTSGYVGLEKWVGGTGTSLGSFTTAIATGISYSVMIVAAGDTFEVWWDGDLKLDVTDPSPPPPFSGHVQVWTDANSQIKVDDVRVWNPSVGTMTTPVRDAGTNRPLEVKIGGTVGAYDQIHVRIRSSADNVAWGPWTNVKSDLSAGVFHKVPDQDRQRYYQLRVTLTSGVDWTPELSELTTTEGTPTTNPTSNTGFEPWYPHVGGMVNAVNGNLWYSKGDLSIPGRGFTLGMARSYNSLRGSEAGPLGNGWTHGYNEKLGVNQDQTVTWNEGDGSQHTFTPKAGSSGYGSPPGITSRLVENVDGSYTLWHMDGSKADFTSAGRLSTITDKNGNQVSLTHDGSGRLTSVADDSGLSLTFGYDASNRITSVADPMGREVVYAYDGSANLVSAKSPMGFYENYTYAAGKLSAVVDPVGKRTAFTYDGSGRLTEIWRGLYESGSVVWQFRDYAIAYTATTERTITNALSFTTTLTLNSFGNPTEIAGPPIGCSACDNRGNSSAYVWDGEMNQNVVEDGRGNAWSYDFDHRARFVSRTDPGGNVSGQGWSEVNNATQYLILLMNATNFRGFTTSYAYDAVGNQVEVTHALGATSYRAYDPFGHVKTATDFLGRVTEYTYDGHGWLTQVEDPLGHVATRAYDSVGRMTSSTTPLGSVMTFEYDDDDRLTKRIDPLGNATSYAYNGRGNLIQVADPNGYVTAYEVNVTNAKTSRATDASGNETLYRYDERSNLVTVTNARGYASTFDYDAFDRMIKETRPSGNDTAFVYDAAGNVIVRTDPNGNLTTYEYDGLDRPVRTNYADGNVTTLEYDANGNVVSSTGFGHTTTDVWDALDRRRSTADDYGTFTKTISYAYDAASRRTRMNYSNGSFVSYAYNEAGWLRYENHSDGQSWRFDYDNDGRRTSVVHPNGVATEYRYDKAGRVTELWTNESGSVLESFAHAYDKVGNSVQVTEADGSWVQYAYDSLYRLGNESYSDGRWIAYAYDANGNRIQKVAHLASTGIETLRPNANGGTTQWSRSGCDSNYQCVDEATSDGDLTYVHTTGNGVTDTYALPDTTLLYGGASVTVVAVAQAIMVEQCEPGDCWALFYLLVNGDGELTGVEATGEYHVVSVTYPTNPATGDPWTVAEVNALETGIEKFESGFTPRSVARLTQLHVQVEVTNPTVTTTYDYDPDDRLLREETVGVSTTTYTYDANGNVRSRAEETGTTTYVYDAEDRLTSVTTPSGSTSYAYAADGRRMRRVADSATTFFGYDASDFRGYEDVTEEYDASGTPTAAYVHGPGIDEPLGFTTTEWQAYHRDGLGSVTRITTTEGDTSASYRYDAFGATRAQTGSDNTYGFASRESESDLGLYYNRARFYDPESGRFLSGDPIGLGGGSNRYAYAGGNPVNRVDPSGMYFTTGGNEGGFGGIPPPITSPRPARPAPQQPTEQQRRLLSGAGPVSGTTVQPEVNWGLVALGAGLIGVCILMFWLFWYAGFGFLTILKGILHAAMEGFAAGLIEAALLNLLAAGFWILFFATPCGLGVGLILEGLGIDVPIL